MNHDETQSRRNDPGPAGALLCAALGSLPATAVAADLNLVLREIEAQEGTLRVAVYASERDFRKTVARRIAVPAQAGETQVTIEDLPAGDYAVLVYQDLNDNNDLDANLLGLPNEPWGGSLNSKYTFGSPSWHDTRFTLPAAGIELTIDMNGG